MIGTTRRSPVLDWPKMPVRSAPGCPVQDGAAWSVDVWHREEKKKKISRDWPA